MRRIKSAKVAVLASQNFYNPTYSDNSTNQSSIQSDSNTNHEHFRGNNALRHFRHRPGHQNVEVAADFNGQFASGHVRGDGRGAQAEFARHGSRGAAAAAGGQRVTSPAFPDFGFNIS